MNELLGKRFFKLEVIKFLHRKPKSPGRGTFWLCRCDCGNLVERSSSSLKEGVKCSCGCYLKSPRKDPEEMGVTRLFTVYKANASKGRRKFVLTKEQFRELILGDCHYCSSKPSKSIQFVDGHAKIVYNGIDRKENDLGYTLENCVSCCKDCNYLKHSRSYNEFLDKIKTIYNVRLLGNQYNIKEDEKCKLNATPQLENQS